MSIVLNSLSWHECILKSSRQFNRTIGWEHGVGYCNVCLAFIKYELAEKLCSFNVLGSLENSKIFGGVNMTVCEIKCLVSGCVIVKYVVDRTCGS